MQVKRERKLESGLGKMRRLCIEVGEDDAECAARVHPSLRNFHETMRGQYYAIPKPADAAAAGGGDAAALTEAVFAALEAALADLEALKQQREKRLAKHTDTLRTMWEQIGIPEDDESRRFFERMLDSPARLHAHTHDKARPRPLCAARGGRLTAHARCINALCVQCKEEISRLEVEMAKQMRVIIQNNVAVVRSLCAETELPVPDLSAVLAGADAENAVAGVLQRINSAVIALRAVLETREPVLRAIKEVEEGFREAHWHFLHQQDNLFNNRVRLASALIVW